MLLIAIAFVFVWFMLAGLVAWGWSRWAKRRRMKTVATPYGPLETPTRRVLRQARRMHPPENGSSGP